MKKRLLSLAMVICLTLTLVPAVAFATEVTAKDAAEFAVRLANAVTGDTIKLTDNISGDGFVIDKSITIDFNGFTYTVSGALVGSTGYETNGVQILAGNTVEFKNGTFTASETAYKPNTTDPADKSNTPCRILIQNYADLTLTDMNIDASKTSYYAVSTNSGNVVINNTKVTAGTTSTALALAIYDYASYSDKPTVTVKGDSEVTGKVNLDGNETVSAAELKIEAGKVNGEIVILKDTSKVVISGGTFDTQPDSALIADDAIVAEVDEGNPSTNPVYAVGTAAIEAEAEKAATASSVGATVLITQVSSDNAKNALTLPAGTKVANITGEGSASVTVNGDMVVVAQPAPTYGVDTVYDTVPAPQPTQAPVQNGKNYWIQYNGGNSFSTNKKDVPTSVEIDGMPVPFSGDGRNFTVSCVLSGAERITVRWNSTSVTTNFKPDASAFCGNVDIPKTGDVSFIGYAVMALVAAAGAMGLKK